jgi:KAP family P-loop domain
VGTYTDFKVLIDDPAGTPGLGFDDYASALAEIVLHSRAEFAVGIFGSWGSGKTTLMRTIERRLAGDDGVVTVWFTAWRYERDPHLIVPLLDVLREALDKRAQSDSGWAREAAAGVARAARVFTAGLSLSVGVPGFGAGLDAGKIIAAIEAENDGTKQLSFYQAGFVMLQDTIRKLSGGGSRRVVIFIDDLDRCVPDNALQILESMKLFFDVEGCVFIVGLDQDIAERAVAAKYHISEPANASGITNGIEYVKKIFQVPFALPPVSPRQLREYLSTIESNSDFGEAQREDFANVRRHLRFLPSDDSINPREIKRLINAYTLQLKMLRRLGDELKPDIVLALQVMSFRPDWRALYDHLAADPQLFQLSLRDIVDGGEPPPTVWLSGVKVTLPVGLVDYLRHDARRLLDVDDLESYVSAAESTRRTDPSIREARVMVNRLRRTTEDLASGTLPVKDAQDKILSDVERFSELTIRRSRFASSQVKILISQLSSAARELERPGSDKGGQSVRDWSEKVTLLFDKLDSLLGELDRQTNLLS